MVVTLAAGAFVAAATSKSTSRTEAAPQSCLTVSEQFRLLRVLPGGRKVYAADGPRPNTLWVQLVTMEAHHRQTVSGSGGPQLGAAHPTTIATDTLVVSGPHATPPLTFGVACDGITSVSFTALGHVQTAPVVNNVWYHIGPNSALWSLTVHYADGHSRTIKR